MSENIVADNQGLVEKILPGGEGIIRNGQGILIHNVVAGDVIEYRITQKRRGILRGELLSVVEPSKDRVSAPCPVASTCGGCALQNMSKACQSILKNTWVNQEFSSFASSETQTHSLQVEQYTFSGRRRVRWFIDQQTLGFRQRLSHQVVHTTQCIALTPSLNELRNQLEANLHRYPNCIESIQAVELHNGYHVIFESTSPYETCLTPAFSIDKPIQYWWRQLETPSIKAINRPAITLFDQIILEPHATSAINIQIGPNDFIQGHQQGNQTLIHQILDWSRGSRRVVDLFSGCGNLSLPIAAAFGTKVIGAESNPYSVKAANQNAKRLNLDASYQCVDLFGKFNIEPFIAADTLIIDPPRKGAKRISKIIQQFFPKQIIMVNCDAAAGARDAKALQQAGFKLQALRPLDLFPYTGHVEVMSLWAQ